MSSLIWRIEPGSAKIVPDGTGCREADFHALGGESFDGMSGSFYLDRGISTQV
jgi:hypothetical protein